MIRAEHDPLETDLARLTEWSGPPTALWKAALASAPANHATGRRGRAWYAVKVPTSAVAVIGLAAVLIVVVPLLQPSFSAARRQSQSASKFEKLTQSAVQTPPVAASADDARKLAALGYSDGRFGDDAGPGAGVYSPRGGRGGPGEQQAAPSGATATAAPAPPGDRQVIRRATIELMSTDVRAAFLKAQAVVSAAGDEYVENSSLTGAGREMQADLTLRVRAERLSAVLNALRELAEVRSERIVGEDVTAQVVDLEARLRNEQRVENELLELLEKRTDAPLKEVLELRFAISNVRVSIETLTAQRERLGRLVSLATVLVLIRTGETPPAVEETVGARFVTAIGDAWRSGVVGLIDSIAAILRIVTAGLIWWVILISAVAIAWRLVRRANPTHSPRERDPG